MRLDLAELRPRADEARLQPPVQRRRRRRPRHPRTHAVHRALVRDGAEGGRRAASSPSRVEGVRRGLGAGAARRRGARARMPCRARCSGRDPESTPCSWPSSGCRSRLTYGRIKDVVQAAFAHRRKTLPNSLELAGLAAREPRRRRARRARSQPRDSRGGAGPGRVRPACGAAPVTTLAAPAKINLALVVGPRRDDGKHELVTVYERIELADTLSLEPADELEVEGFPADTLVTQALTALASAAGVEPAWRITIEKRIPVGAGLGGGSSDAAAALTLANETPRTAARSGGAPRPGRGARRRRAPLPYDRPAARRRRRHAADSARPAARLLRARAVARRRAEALDEGRVRRVRRPQWRASATPSGATSS